MEHLTYGFDSEPETLFFLESGRMKPTFKCQLDELGYIPKQVYPEYDAYHILNVQETFKKYLCFPGQENTDFELRNITVKLSCIKATHFLEDEYLFKKSIMPHNDKPINAIFPCYNQQSVYKRFHSLEISELFNYRFENVFFIVKDWNIKQSVIKIIQSSFKNTMKNKSFFFVPVKGKIGTLAEGLQKIRLKYSLEDGFSIISDQFSALNDDSIAKMYSIGVEYWGITMSPIRDWRVEMNLYYSKDSKISQDEETIKWAQFNLRQKILQVFREAKIFMTS